jgi:hypothetical protein
LDERSNFLQPAILAKWTGLVASPAKLESDEIMVEVHDLLDVRDLAA